MACRLVFGYSPYLSVSWFASYFIIKTIIYARCSTDEKKQDVEVQLKQLREYCVRQGWEYEEQYEYASGSKEIPETLRKILRLVKEKRYDVFLVYDLTRFSRLHPSTTNKMLDFIAKYCRFVSLQDNIDSSDEIKWLIIKPIFQYMAWVYSKNLSEKVKLGMARAKEKGKAIGRPKGSKDSKERSKKGYYQRYEEKLPI